MITLSNMCNIKCRDGSDLEEGLEAGEINYYNNEMDDSTDNESVDLNLQDADGSNSRTNNSLENDSIDSDLQDSDDDDDEDMDEDDESEDSDQSEDDFLSGRNRNGMVGPPRINCDDIIIDLSFHPSANVLAAASITGDVILYNYDTESVSISNTLEVHTKACRAVEYSEDGDLLFSTSKDGSIMISDSHTGKLKDFYDKAHDVGLYCLNIISEHLFASGDEDGVVKVWDIRHKDAIFSLDSKIRDYISGMVTTESKRYLACTSGEGTLTTINIPARKFHVQSEVYESEYTCVDLCRDDSKLVVGTASGKLVFYNWGEFGLHSDIFPGPSKKAINCLVSISDNIVVTGWEDGQLRATYLFPNKSLGIVGQHDLSVDAMDISHDGKYIASCSLDQKIQFWPISYFNDIDFTNIMDDSTNLPSSQYTDKRAFFADLE